MLLEDSVCLFVNYGGPKLGNFHFIVFSPFHPISSVLGCLLEFWFSFC